MKFLFRFFQIPILIFLLITILSAQDKNISLPSTSPQSGQSSELNSLPPDLINFFVGEWSGQGEFASGKKIEADMIFTAELDNYWLSYRHTDRSPNKYKALGMWGYSRETGKLIMVVQDNFGGSRIFVSDGWTNEKIVFLKEVKAAISIFPERFTFEKQTDKSFKMTYEAMKDGKTWKVGDYLVFARK